MRRKVVLSPPPKDATPTPSHHATHLLIGTVAEHCFCFFYSTWEQTFTDKLPLIPLSFKLFQQTEFSKCLTLEGFLKVQFKEKLNFKILLGMLTIRKVYSMEGKFT